MTSIEEIRKKLWNSCINEKNEYWKWGSHFL